MSDTPEGNICRVSAELGWAADTLAVVDKALLKLSAEVKTLKRERDEAREALEYIAHSGMAARHIADYAIEFLEKRTK